MRKKILMLAVFTFLGTTTLLAMGRRLEGALNPTLLWEKEFVELSDRTVKLAKISGEAISVERREEGGKLFVFDKSGEILFTKEGVADGCISDDGSRILYATWQRETGETYEKMYYCDRQGQIKWNIKAGNSSIYLAPDGNIIATASIPLVATQLLKVHDATGKEIFSYKLGETIDVIFSPDSEYIIANSFTFPDKNRQSRVYKSQTGELLWKKQGEGIQSVSEDIAYLVGLRGVYNNKGDMIFDKGTFVSESGEKLIVCYPEKIELISLPEKTVLKTYTIKGKDFGFSYDGRYLVIIGERTDVSSPNNLFVIDTETDEIWETKVEPASKSEFNQTQVFLTKDGKYMLIQARGKLYYYQLY